MICRVFPESLVLSARAKASPAKVHIFELNDDRLAKIAHFGSKETLSPEQLLMAASIIYGGPELSGPTIYTKTYILLYITLFSLIMFGPDYYVP